MRLVNADQDKVFMAHAIELAKRAESNGEVPVGALLVRDGKILGQGANQSVNAHDPTAHAEIVAIRDAAKFTGNYRLTGSVLYVTMEPCVMCAGALLHARVKRLVFGCYDERAGAAGSVVNLLQTDFLNHKCEVESGVLRDQCAELMRNFFQARRNG